MATSVIALGVGTGGAAMATPVTNLPVRASQQLAAAAPAGYPTSPPAQICGNGSVLSGPAVQPAGSVLVGLGTNLFDVTQANGPGTTFWLTPGTHTLGTGQFDQVIPRDNDTYIGAPGAIIDGQGVNLTAFGQPASGVTIEFLTIKNFIPYQDQAAINHDSGSGWTIQYDTIQGMAKAAMNAGPNSVTRYNCITASGQTGINGLTGTANVTIDHNELSLNSTGPNAPGEGCGCEAAVKLFGVQNVAITNNWVHDNGAQGLWGDTNAVGWLIQGNYINNNADEAIFYETSYNAFINNNTISHNALVKGAVFAARNDSFPMAAVYISESGGDSRVFGGKYSTLEISGNNFDNNYGGVTLWEDANRFCNTSGNTAPGFCPIAGAGGVGTCVAGTINNPPYYADCRWHTQNVLVDHNIFQIDKAALNCVNARCGENSLFSQTGSSPPWSPYLGDTIKTAITFNQNNHFANNSYTGDWSADVFAQGQQVTFAQWQAAPYNQDQGSTITRPNAIDADTSTLEGSLGQWAPWYSSTVARSSAQAHGGSHSLQIGVTAVYGWGVTLNNYPYFPETPGTKTASFWGMTTSAGNLGATMDMVWHDAGGAVLTTDSVSIATLSSTWQQGSAVVTAPAGTVAVEVHLHSLSGAVGNSIFLDDFVIADGGTPPPPPPPPPAGDTIDADTATLESSIGSWIPWYSATVAQSAAQAHGGSHSLQVGVTAPYGWGVLNNHPYYAETPGPKTIGFWAKTTSTGNLAATMDVNWRDGSGAVLKTDSVSTAALTGTWQQATAVVTAPAGTVAAGISLHNSSGVTGNSIFLDDFVILDGGVPPPPPPPPAGDAVDADTATLESSLGHWTPWYSSTVAQSAAQAHSGTHSLQIGVTAPYGWGVLFDNGPSFAETPGVKTISFWGMTTSSGNLAAAMDVTWRNASGAVLKTDSVSIPALTGTWRQASASVTAPAGTVAAGLSLHSPTGTTGDNIFLDDFFVST